jgi:hypothetical protein
VTHDHNNASNSDTRLNAAIRHKENVSRQAQEDQDEDVMESSSCRLFIAHLLRA